MKCDILASKFGFRMGQLVPLRHGGEEARAEDGEPGDVQGDAAAGL
jgi:hypothetical protein